MYFLGFSVFGLPDAYVTRALEEEKANLPSLLLNTARRFLIEIEMWFVNQRQKKNPAFPLSQDDISTLKYLFYIKYQEI